MSLAVSKLSSYFGDCLFCEIHIPAIGRDTHMHRVVISSATKRCQPSEDGNWFGRARNAESEMLTGQLWNNRKTPKLVSDSASVG